MSNRNFLIGDEVKILLSDQAGTISEVNQNQSRKNIEVTLQDGTKEKFSEEELERLNH